MTGPTGPCCTGPTGQPGKTFNLVLRPGEPGGSHDNVYVTWEEVIAAAQAIQGGKLIQIDSLYSGVVVPASIQAKNPSVVGGFGASPPNPALPGTVTFTDPAGLFTPAMIGRGIRIQGATTPSNNGEYIITAVPFPTQVVWAKPLSALSTSRSREAGLLAAGT